MNRLDQIYSRLTELRQSLEDSQRWDRNLMKVYAQAQSVKDMQDHNPRHWKMLSEYNDLISELAAIKRKEWRDNES